MNFRRVLVFILAAAPMAPMSGATWILVNGDRITGEVMAETAGGIRIRHAMLGEVKLPRTALRQTGESAGPGPAAGLQGRISEHLSLNLRYDYDEDRSLAAPPDRRWSSSVGVLW